MRCICVSLEELQPGTEWSAMDALPVRVLPPYLRHLSLLGSTHLVPDRWRGGGYFEA